ncbi:MAG: formylglycine-generating enzyme family protein [Planctomycetota bacterium]
MWIRNSRRASSRAKACAALLWWIGLGSFGIGAAQSDDDDKKVAQDESVYPEMPEGRPPVAEVKDAEATKAEEMKPYREQITGTSAEFEMLPIPGGTFTMGSPDSEADREDGEGPQIEVAISPFWMGKHEVRWDEYHLFMYKLDLQQREKGEVKAAPQDAWADAVSRPTPPYVPMDFEMGVKGYPAICMTQFAAKQYTKWLSMKTGRFYRLPTEAEWEYACRAGTKTAYSFGDDPDELDAFGWYFDNADDQYQKPGQKKPNAFGLYDMHGNVAEWVLDGYDPVFYRRLKEVGNTVKDPINWPKELYPRVVRGGSWDDDPEWLRSAARRPSKSGWKVQDPQLPKSIWYHTDARFVGFRVVRPLVAPSPEEQSRYWEADLDEIREIQDRQRKGGR